MNAFHYTTLDGWEKMNKGDPDYAVWNPIDGTYIDGRLVRGLWPNRRLIPQGIESSLTPPESTRPKIFTMHSEFPEEWLRNEEFPDLFDYLIRGIVAKSKAPYDERKLVLLEVNLSQADEPFVVDYAHVVRGGKKFSETKRLDCMIKSSKRYWDSRVPLNQYSGGHVLPEVFFEGPIPLDRLTKLWELKYDPSRSANENLDFGGK